MAGWINWAVLVDEEGEEGVKRRSEGENRTRGRERMRKHWRDKPTGAKLIWMCVTILPQSRIAFVFLVCVCAPWLEIAYVQIKDFPLLFSCRLRVVVDWKKSTPSWARNEHWEINRRIKPRPKSLTAADLSVAKCVTHLKNCLLNAVWAQICTNVSKHI